MKLTKSQSGFSIVELVIIVAVVGVLGFVGYTVYNRQQDNKTVSNDNSSQVADESPTANNVSSAPEIKTTDDLTKAEATLDQTDPGASNTDATQLDSQASAF